MCDEINNGGLQLWLIYIIIAIALPLKVGASVIEDTNEMAMAFGLGLAKSRTLKKIPTARIGGMVSVVKTTQKAGRAYNTDLKRYASRLSLDMLTTYRIRVVSSGRTLGYLSYLLS